MTISVCVHSSNYFWSPWIGRAAYRNGVETSTRFTRHRRETLKLKLKACAVLLFQLFVCWSTGAKTNKRKVSLLFLQKCTVRELKHQQHRNLQLESRTSASAFTPAGEPSSILRRSARLSSRCSDTPSAGRQCSRIRKSPGWAGARSRRACASGRHAARTPRWFRAGPPARGRAERVRRGGRD